LVVRGGTTTALCGALAGFYRAIPVAHLEAGLRTDDVRHPFPDEANRRLITTLATVHIAPTPANAARLHAEGVDPRAIVVTGSTGIDALLDVLRRRPSIATPGLQALLADPRPIVTVAALRRESWGQPIAEVAVAVAEIASRHDVQIVWPLHSNPAVRNVVAAHVGSHSRIALLDPLPYADFVQLLERSRLVLSDSGGVEVECTALGVPVIVLRAATERTEAVETRASYLAGTDAGRIVELASALLRHADGGRRAVTLYGDGRAADRCAGALAAYLLGAAAPEPFRPRAAPCGHGPRADEGAALAS
jgi:UDP-N-acetylglucosamine 2-epimerase (non-hydrolysing)